MKGASGPVRWDGSLSWLASLPAHSVEFGTGHVYSLNALGESVCGCGSNLGVLEWRAEEMVRHACPGCEWVQDAIPAVDKCPVCFASLIA